MNDNLSFSLVGDIGGTNARLALVREGEVRPEAIEVLPCGDYDNLDSAITAYLAKVGVASVTEASALGVLGIAITGGLVYRRFARRSVYATSRSSTISPPWHWVCLMCHKTIWFMSVGARASRRGLAW